MPIDSHRFAEALRFALEAHGAQVRKGTEVPYITHPVAVAAALAQYGCGEELVIAGLLHDTAEDAGVSFIELAQRFGARVAELVKGVTEEKSRDGEHVPWPERKEQALRHLQTADADVVRLKAADTLHNIQSILRDRRIAGDEIWKRFNAGKEAQVWYYTSVAETVRERLGGWGLAVELMEAAEELGR